MTGAASDDANPEGGPNEELERQQPLGFLNPKLLLAIGAVLLIAGIVTLIVLLQGS